MFKAKTLKDIVNKGAAGLKGWSCVKVEVVGTGES